MQKRSRMISIILIMVMMISVLLPNMMVYAESQGGNSESIVVASNGSLYAATYHNTVPSLPDQVEGENITWPKLDAKQFSDLYSVVNITGTKDNGSSVTLSVEVVPKNLVYFIDSGTGTEWSTIMKNSKDASAARNLISLPYMAVKALTGETLLNDVSDQYYDNTRTWGVGYTKITSSSDRADPIQSYWNNNVAPSDGSEITNKYAAGLRASNSNNFKYYLTLEAGTYTLTTGFHEFYNNNHNRGMVPKVYNNADGTLIAAFDTVSMSNNGNSSSAPDIISSGSFTLKEKTVIQIHYEKVSGENGSMNWLAVNREDFRDVIEQVKADVKANQENGVIYAENPLQPGEYTGAGAAPKDNLADLNAAIAAAEKLIDNGDYSSDALAAYISDIQNIYKNLRVLPGTYENIPGTVGNVILASNTGLPMQAHGGSASAMKEGTAEGCINFDLDGDGQITEGKLVYLWYGENKTNNTRPVDGVRCYSSTDLYNWRDMGNVMYLQNTILPIEISDERAITSERGASGVGTTQNYNTLQFSDVNYNTLKEWGKMETAPEGVSEEDFGNVKLFLRAYVTKFDKEPNDLYDTAWTASEYDETSIIASSFLYPDSETVGNTVTNRLRLAFEGLYGGYCITERPKMIYNEAASKFIIVFHADGPLYNNADMNTWVASGCQGNCPSSRYSRAMIGFAESDTPFGPFKLVNMTRMNYEKSLNSERLGESRDMTVFVDQGVDNNKDGVDDAYAVYSSEMNAKLYVSLLNKDYTGPIAEGNTAKTGVDAAYRILADDSREAPAVMKYDGWYYLITSGTDGWNSTAHIYYRSQNMFTGWEKVGNPALNDTGKCFDTQVTYVLSVDAENGKFIYMADRWNGNNLTDSRTIWLPIQMNSDHTISILNKSYWTVDVLDDMAPVKVYTELPEVVYSDGSNLPDTLVVSYKGEKSESKVVWSEDSLKNIGNTTLMGTLTDCGNVQVQSAAFVSPVNLLYFVNPSKTPLSDDYNKLVELNKTTLKNADTNDGAYSVDAGFGYIGAEGKVRDNNADIYQSMRYASATANSIVYQFDLEQGEYDVYIGMFDPSGWYKANQRFADISLNGSLVTEKYAYLNNVNDTLHYADVQPDENGKLIVTVAPNKSNTAAVQVSFVMIAGKAPEVPKELPFIDVKQGDWFYEAVYNNYFKGIMTGLNDVTFGPEQTLTRAQFAVMLYRVEGAEKMPYSSRFSDVENGEWYTDAVLWAAEKGIVKGYDNSDKFGTHDNVTREQIAVMMCRYAALKGYETDVDADLSSYEDVASISGFATEAMKWAVGNSIITGKNNGTLLDPTGYTLRAESAVIIDRFMEKY